MKRFVMSQKHPGHGTIEIFDILNTEPVCVIYANYHPDKVDIIFDALEKAFGDVPVDKCECGNEKPQEFLHCGCKY